METVRVIARANILGLLWGDHAEVPANDFVEMLIGAGKLELVDDLDAVTEEEPDGAERDSEARPVEFAPSGDPARVPSSRARRPRRAVVAESGGDSAGSDEAEHHE